ncbi:phist protein [Plasmodium cynomolgi strain B]|uniref:Phist protein n=1 Tax=Plasmodium cynomolgi (strain B) TaxID=1120755 RepID=K6V274_PLACD|nr:phist protein [Plasmodium cynomolgi strain B]GAB69345.1 phist protein [Plasmodium cynomolgi strain B]
MVVRDAQECYLNLFIENREKVMDHIMLQTIIEDNHGEFNVRDLNDKLEDARGSKGNMVKHHKENKRTSVGMNRKRNKNREQYCEEEEMYDEYSGQNWQYTDANHDDRYRNESYYGEMYDENNRKGQTYADEKHNNHNYTNEEYYNGEPDMYNSNEEEIIPHNDNSNLDSFNDVMRGYSKGGRAQKRGNKNNVIPEVNSMGNTQTSNREISYETHQESSLNRNCPIFQDDVDTILEKLGDMVHYTDMINIFVIVNLMERNEFFDALQSLMTYWNDYDNGSKISDEYKHKQWLKVYGDMTNELMQKERKFYNKLYHILDNTHIQKRVYINFINEVRYTWIKMRQEIKGQWKGYLENKAKRYKRKT